MRTEQDVLKGFEKLGYVVNWTSLKSDLVISFADELKIHIDLTHKNIYCIDISIQEHKLLNELFQIWGWL